MIDNRKFISFEGIDFSGKTTQIKLLENRLKKINENITILREPGGTIISEYIRDILLDNKLKEMSPICEVFLYSAARNQLVIEKITKELKAGNFVIADRYVDSTTAYQGFGRSLPVDLINTINKAATGGLMPSITFILDIDPLEIVERKKNRNIEMDRLESSGIEFYHRVCKGYHKIAELDSRRVKIIDAALTINQISDQIWEFVTAKINYNYNI
jgi:dTMP kinase